VSGAVTRRNSLAGLVETNHCVHDDLAANRPEGNGSSNDAWLGQTADGPPPPTPAKPCGAPANRPGAMACQTMPGSVRQPTDRSPWNQPNPAAGWGMEDGKMDSRLRGNDIESVQW